jgi:hypothetical protein
MCKKRLIEPLIINNSILRTISIEETSEIVRRFLEKTEDYSIEKSIFGTVCLVLKNQSAIVANLDGTVTWFARTICLTNHTFIELKTGETNPKTIYLLFCLVNAKSREFAEILLNSTIKEGNGRLGAKDAEIAIVAPDGRRFEIHLDLKTLVMSYMIFQMFPQDFIVRSKLPYCPLCKETFGQPSRDDNNE